MISTSNNDQHDLFSNSNEVLEFSRCIYYIVAYYALQAACIALLLPYTLFRINCKENMHLYSCDNPAVCPNGVRACQAFLNAHKQARASVMGNLYSKAKRAIIMRTIGKKTYKQNILPIRINELDAKIENRATTLDEKSPAVLKYRTPHFKATATVKFPPLESGEHWKIGWIQACTRMEFYNSYGEHGYSSWEFPQLMSGDKPMISDSDGRNYPWYGSKSEVIEVQGPCDDYTLIKVNMNDNFYPHITWDIPTSNERLSRLTHVARNQQFYTWLVAMDAINGSILVLKTIRWQMKLEIGIDPLKPQGSRAKLISDPAPEQPEILKQNVRIPTCILYPPNVCIMFSFKLTCANSAQILVWHPLCRLGEISRRPEIVVPPRCMVILDQNPFYSNYIRHKTHTSIQNKLNGGGSSSASGHGSGSSSSSSESPPRNIHSTKSSGNDKTTAR
ncbi:unnamed protein product, partial [Didymodactylos carnosus]